MSDHIVTIEVEGFERMKQAPVREPYVSPFERQLERIQAVFDETAADLESLRHAAVGTQTEET